MLPSGRRCVRSKVALFLRLWVVRHRYDQLGPFGEDAEERLLYHLEQLRESWERIASCQRALGLEVRPFAPEEQFEAIYVVSGYAQRALNDPQNERPDLLPAWRNYLAVVNALSHEMNPFDFSDRCQRCLEEIRSMVESLKSGVHNGGSEPAPVIPFHRTFAEARS